MNTDAYKITSGMTARNRYDLTHGLFGTEVPVTSPIIKWKNGHRTILPAIYDEFQTNLCDSVDIPIIKYLAECPASTPGSLHVTHLSYHEHSTSNIEGLVRESLSQNKPVVIRGVESHNVDKRLTADFLDTRYAISPNRVVWVHGNVEAFAEHQASD